MNVAVEGKNIDITAGESILCALRRAGTDFSNPAEKPVAAMIGGEVFNLNYTPKRECSIRLLRYGDDEGRRVYERTLQFVLIIAVRKLFPGARLVTRYSAGDGLYICREGGDGCAAERGGYRFAPQRNETDNSGGISVCSAKA